MSNVAQASKKVRATGTFDASLKTSRDGYSFVLNANKWVLNKDTTISFQKEVLALEDNTHSGFRKSLARYAEEVVG